MRTREIRRKRVAISLSVIYLTFAFVLMTAPVAIVQNYFKDFMSTSVGLTVFLGLCTIQITYHALMLIIMLWSNKIFRREFYCMFKISPQSLYRR
jgi:hypothetical protein